MQFAVDYNDGKFVGRAGDNVPADMPKHKQEWLLRTGLAVVCEVAEVEFEEE